MSDAPEPFNSVGPLIYRMYWPAEPVAGDERFFLVYGQLGGSAAGATWGLAVIGADGTEAVEHVWDGRPRRARVADLTGWLRQFATPDAADALAGRFAATRPDLLERR